MKEFLSRHNVPFQNKLASEPVYRAELDRHAKRQVPLAAIGDRDVIGYNPRELAEALIVAGYLSASELAVVRRKPVNRLRADQPLSQALVVPCFMGNVLHAIDRRTGGFLSSDRESSTIEMDGRPRDIETIPQAGTFAAICYEAGTVTFFSLEDARYLHGDYDKSTRQVGEHPLDAIPHPSAPILYVSSSEGRRVVAFDARTGDYLNGTLDASSAPLPGIGQIMAYHAGNDILFVRLPHVGFYMLDGRTLKPYTGSAESSTVNTRFGMDIALSPDERVLYLPEGSGEEDGVVQYEAATGHLLHGTRADSVLRTGNAPFGIAVHPTRPILYAISAKEKRLELRDARTGEYLFSDEARSTVPVGGGSRDILIDAETDVVYISCFDEDCILMLDAATGAYRNGTRERSMLATARGPRMGAFLGASGARG